MTTREEQTLELLAGIDICPVCNNGITLDGSWVRVVHPYGVAPLSWGVLPPSSSLPTHHCVGCHQDFSGEDAGRMCQVHQTACLPRIPTYAKCLKCREIVHIRSSYSPQLGYRTATVAMGGYLSEHACFSGRP